MIYNEVNVKNEFGIMCVIIIIGWSMINSSVTLACKQLF